MTSTATIRGTGYLNGVEMDMAELTVIHEVETLWSHGPRADPDWSYVDEAGHFHAAHKVKQDSVTYPTLKSESIAMPCNGSCGGVCEGEGYTSIKRTCQICREEIVPAVIRGDYQFSIPRRTNWTAKVTGLSSGALNGLQSLRLVCEGTEFFGVVSVAGLTTSVFDNRLSLDLHGVSELGRRKATVVAGRAA